MSKQIRSLGQWRSYATEVTFKELNPATSRVGCCAGLPVSLCISRSIIEGGRYKYENRIGINMKIGSIGIKYVYDRNI